MKIGASLLLALAVGACVACAPVPEPAIASPAAQAGYAEGYPAAMQATLDEFNREDEAARTLDIATTRYPDELKNPKWQVVLDVSLRADEAGRSRSYVERAREIEGASAFFDASKEEINKKVSGSAQYVVKQKSCSADVSGAVTHALDEAIEKQIEERTRQVNEAHRLIDRYRASLGPENAATLARQADAISKASYVVGVKLVEEKIRLRAVLEDAEQVQKTLDASIAAERAFQSEGGRTDAEKKAAGERIAAMDRSRGLVNAAVAGGKDLESRVETRITAAQKRHADAMAALKDALTKRGAR